MTGIQDPAVTIAMYALISSIVTAILSAIVAILIAWLNYKQETRAKALVTATTEVKETLQTNTAIVTQDMAQLKEVTDKTHAAVNGSMGIAMRLAWTQADRIACLTGDPADVALATQAKEAYQSHEESTRR